MTVTVQQGSAVLICILTQEGVKGNEHMPTATHNTTMPFARLPAGAADYTICYYSFERLKTTLAQ
jgi:alpha-glucosidase